MIQAFIKLLFTFGQVQPGRDVIGDLPTEVAANIFRYLDDGSLVSAAGVNRRWKSVCAGSAVLRRRVRRRLRAERRARVQAYFDASAGVQVVRKAPGAVFGQRNGTVAVRAQPVQYQVPVCSAPPQMRQFKALRKASNKVHPTLHRDASQKKRKLDINGNVVKSTNKKAMRL